MRIFQRGGGVLLPRLNYGSEWKSTPVSRYGTLIKIQTGHLFVGNLPAPATAWAPSRSMLKSGWDPFVGNPNTAALSPHPLSKWSVIFTTPAGYWAMDRW